MRTPRSLTLFSLLVALPLAAAAQENQSTAEPGGLVIQIMQSNGSAPAFLTVPAANAKRSSMWTPRFDRVAGVQPEPGTPPVRAVNFASSAEGDAARVFVSVFVGISYFEDQPGLTAPDSIAMLIQRVSALNDQVPPAVVEKLIAGPQSADRTANLESLTGTIQVTMHQVKKYLLDEIHAFQNSHQKAPEDTQFRAWLTATLERYSEWRSRLK